MMVRRIVKGMGVVFGLLILVALGTTWWVHEPKPSFVPNAEGDRRATAMLQALRVEEWARIDVIEWTFVGLRSYRWDKTNNTVQVRWANNEVWVDLNRQTGEVRQPASQVGDAALVQRAIRAFNNDSFWLAAPYKVFDPGTSRSWITLPDGREGLMVTYSKGGTTPGDSYVWLLDADHRPIGLKMWVSVIPLGGVEVSWEDYAVLSNGAMVAQSHRGFAGVNVGISDISVEWRDTTHVRGEMAR